MTPSSAGAVERLRGGTVVAVGLGSVYLATLLPGVGAGDVAEIQYMSPLLGICHMPGYAIEVVFGKLFGMLPVGPSIAWRLNLLMAVCGVVGGLALYGAVCRVTGSVPAGLVAAALLGFSSIYWNFSIAAEAYVFHTMFLLVGVYAAVRLVTEGRSTWLYVTALAVGTCVAGRCSEAFVLPAFAGILPSLRMRCPGSIRRVLLAVVLFVLPFAFSVGFYLVRQDPHLLHARDAAFKLELLGEEAEELDRAAPHDLRSAVLYNLGSYWAGEAARHASAKKVRAGLARYARLLSGISIVAGDAPPSNLKEQEEGFGAAVGLPGVLLALVGAMYYRRAWRWVLLGGGLFAGNLVFYLWHYRWDGLTFTTPGLAGLAFLAGLGVAGSVRKGNGGGWRTRPGLAVGLLTALALVAGNYRLVDRSSQTQPLWSPHMPVKVLRRLPQDSVLVMGYWPSTTYRYLLHVEARRRDVRVIVAGRTEIRTLLQRLRPYGYPVFVHTGRVPRTGSGGAPEIARYGFVRVF